MPVSQKYACKAIVYDLDGTLIYNDLSMDLCIIYLKEKGLVGLIHLILWIFRGKLYLKNRLALNCLEKLNVEFLPYTSVLETRMNCVSENVLIASGSHQLVVDKIAKKLKVSENSIGSGELGNLVGKRKAEVLTDKFGNDFAYVGNSNQDIEVWKVAKFCFAYNASESTIKKAEMQGVHFQSVSLKPSIFHPLFKSLRMHQWTKNLLLILPALLNIQFYESFWIPSLFFMFIGFSLVASSTYLVNDLLDISSDRAHTKKKSRAFASGSVSIPQGGVAIFTLFSFGLIFCSFSNIFVALGAIFYAISSLLYSFYLKRYALIDAIALSFFYVCRVLIGGLAIGSTNNIWFLCSMAFFFLSLGLGKRVIELKRVQIDDQLHTTLPGRGYMYEDLNVIKILGVGAAYTTILLVLIYGLISDQVIFSSDWSVVLICALLFFWQARFWLLIQRNRVDDDPVRFALKDRTSLSVLAVFVAISLFEQIS